MSSDADLLVWQDGPVGRLRLNRPDALNALTHDMVHTLEAALAEWRNDDSVRWVVIDATGTRAFCAGGDIQDLYSTGRTCPEHGRRFWREEYRLNAMIASYPKPYVAIMAGITMGGGVGISAHGSHRIVTETTMLAMPEVTIGFLPDVGGTWLLSRAPGRTGEYLGMTGARMDAGDAIFAGFADHFVKSGNIEPFVNALVDGTAPDGAVAKCSGTTPPESKLAGQQSNITDAFDEPNVLTCIKRLEARSASGDEWATGALKKLRYNAPLSVAAALEAVRRGRGLKTLEECLALEYRFAHRTLEGHDFFEGVRAAVIDRDRAPKWQPAQHEDVTAEMVEKVLAPLGDQEWQAA